MSFLDTQASAHQGSTRTTPPGTGAEPQRDALLSAHFGYLAIMDGSEPTFSHCAFVSEAVDQEIQIALSIAKCVQITLSDSREVQA